MSDVLFVFTLPETITVTRQLLTNLMYFYVGFGASIVIGISARDEATDIGLCQEMIFMVVVAYLWLPLGLWSSLDETEDSFKDLFTG